MKHHWKIVLAALLAAAMTAGCASGAKVNANAKAIPETPAMLADALQGFAVSSAPLLLNDSGNCVYSPMSLYYALAMLTECAYGDTKNELLQAMGQPCDCDWGEAMQTLFGALTFDNDDGRLLLANSLWLSDAVDFKQNTLDRLKENYAAESHSVDMGDADGASKQIAKWVRDNTNDLLGQDETAFRPDAGELARLINTVYFYDKWQDEFNKDKTVQYPFTASDGHAVTADYMCQTIKKAPFVQTKDYTAAALHFANGGRMIFILPAEDKTPAELLQDSVTLSAALDFATDTEQRSGEVRWRVPKFSLCRSMKLIPALQAMGIERAFGPLADLSALTDGPAFVSSVTQDACIQIDEAGCEAAAFTQVVITSGVAVPEEGIDMFLTRPFIFAVTAPTDDLLFLGVVNDPTES